MFPTPFDTAGLIFTEPTLKIFLGLLAVVRGVVVYVVAANGISPGDGCIEFYAAWITFHAACLVQVLLRLLYMSRRMS